MPDDTAKFLRSIRRAVKNGKVLVRKHADERAGERGIPYSSIIDAILTGEAVEDYPDAKPFPACLLMKHDSRGNPLYVVCSYDGEYCYIITVHWLDPDKWKDPWTRSQL